ncbi:MAG: hypothetical protein HY280_00920 [Nitrospinae bacterium]|nr:hypothetical protein [Nitrospinota bacterium]
MTIELAGLHISRDAVRGVRVLHDGKEWQITDLYSSPWADGETLAAALRECREKFGPEVEWAVGIPQADVSVRPVSFPFGGHGAITAAMPFEMETFLPYSANDMETCHITISSVKTETKTLGFAIRKERVQFYRNALKTAGITARSLSPEATALVHLLRLARQNAESNGLGATLLGEVVGDDLLLCLADKDGFCDVHSANADGSEVARFQAAVGMEPSDIFIGGDGFYKLAKIRHEQSPEFLAKLRLLFGENWKPENLMIPLGLAAMAAAKADEPTFVVDREGRGGVPSALRRAAIGAGICVLLVLGYLGYRHHAKQVYYDQLRQQSVKVFETALPGVKAVKPPFQLKQKIDSTEKKLRLAGLDGAGRMDLLWVLKRLSETVPEGLPVELGEITYERDNVTIAGKTDKFESVTRLKELYSIVTPFKSCEVVESTAVADKKISFKMRMGL